MAPKQTPKTDPKPEGQAPAGQGAPEQSQEPEWTWDNLPEPAEMPEKVAFTGIKANVLTTVPEPIRQRAETSLGVNAKRVAAKAGSAAKRSRVNYHWSLQIVPSEQRGNEFIKAIIKYAKYRPSDVEIPHALEGSPTGQVTARCGAVSHYRREDDGTYVATDPTTAGAVLAVRYSVRPFEQRGDTARVPGSE